MFYLFILSHTLALKTSTQSLFASSGLDLVQYSNRMIVPLISFESIKLNERVTHVHENKEMLIILHVGKVALIPR
jgi:hypothetical protein